jgi:integrative and conjugative element protein (TIGR02256 family)
MIDIDMPLAIESRLITALQRAGTSEIGGVLMGEHTGHNAFRIADISIQDRGGSFGAFVRNIAFALESLGKYFVRTNHEYQKFNYLGEWHSHPSFETRPSCRDEQSMYDIINDPTVGAQFVVLLIVKIGRSSTMEASATVYLPGQIPVPASLSRGTQVNDG